MSIEADKALWELGDCMSDMPQSEPVRYVRQLLIELMDYTEQSDDEIIWCELNELLKHKYPPTSQLE